MKPFFSRLSYSAGNEDFRTEQEALKIKPDDRIICVTGSGDRPLHLLMEECKEVIAVDANPVQNFLLKLKAAALEQLTYEEYITFLGVEEGSPLAFLERVMQGLDEEAKAFWTSARKTIEKGVIYQGAMETWGRRCSKLIRLMRGKKLDKLFSFDDIEKQREFVEKEWDTWAWRRLFDVVLNPVFAKWMLKDPGLYFNIDPEYKDVARAVYNQMDGYFKRHLAQNSLLLSLVMYGKMTKSAIPAYLSSEGALKIKPRLGKLSIHTDNVIAYLQQVKPNSIDGFSLSDIASYIDAEQFVHLLHAMKRAAKPGARFSIREFLSRQRIPPSLESIFVRDPELEKRLALKDNCAVYTFTVGQII